MVTERIKSILLLSVFLPILVSCHKSEQKAPNILFISIDDLRPELGAYGKSNIISPNIDQLATEGTLFQRAYCNVPVCGASRASLLTGIYPTPDRFYDYKSRVDLEATYVTTLPEHFRNNGYYTSAVGKIFHHPDDGRRSWSKETYRPDYPRTNAQQELWRDYQSAENSYTQKTSLPLGAAGPAWEMLDADDTIYYDGKTTALALKELDKLAKLDKPFFFGVGYIRPHLPFNAPKKYWDLYDPEEIKLPDNYYMPENAPADAWFNYPELRAYTNIANDTLPIPEEQVRMLRHGYYACVSFIDAQVGRVISKLKDLGLYDNTIIILWGDHGWSLGEHTLWNKHSCFNNALRSALIIRSPNKENIGETNALASFVDIYPTLSDMAALPKPGHLVGRSLRPLLQNADTTVNDYVFARWRNGETIKHDRFSYTQYYDQEGKLKSSMLYDHKHDPEENINLAGMKDYQEITKKLKHQLEDHIASR